MLVEEIKAAVVAGALEVRIKFLHFKNDDQLPIQDHPLSVEGNPI